MKKIILWGFYAICLVCSRQQWRRTGKTVRVTCDGTDDGKRAERLADELELKGDARSEFLVTYKKLPAGFDVTS